MESVVASHDPPLLYSLLDRFLVLIEWLIGAPVYAIPQRRLGGLLEADGSDQEKVFGRQPLVAAMLAALVGSAAKLTPLRRWTFAKAIEAALRTRRALIKWVLAKKEIADIPLPPPLLVTGLPHAGASLLQRLLACDPGARAFRAFEMDKMLIEDLLPPPSKRGYQDHPNIDREGRIMLDEPRLAPSFYISCFQSHRKDPTDFEDDCMILEHQLYFWSVIDSKVSSLRFNNEYMLEVYIYLKRYLQAFTSTYKPKSHIILKSNFHSHSLPSFLSVFPNARIITTHRQIPQVLPSLTLLTARLASLSTSQSTPLPRSTVTSFCTTELKHMSTSLLDLRRRVAQDWFTPFPNIATPPPSSNHAISSKQFFDVSHDALVRDPILTVKAIYKHFDMPFSADFEKAMREYVRMNPPFATRKVMGVEERRRVESAYGIPSMQELQESFADYHSYFGVD